MPERNLKYLKHIFDCINDIETFVEGYNENTFINDKKTFNASIRMFEVIGEATKRIGADFKTQHNHIDWKRIAGLRDVLIYDYEGVDLDAVWQIIKINLPQLKKEIENLLN